MESLIQHPWIAVNHLTWTSVNMNTKLYKHIVRGITPVYQCFVQIEPWIGRGNSPLTKAKNHKSMRFSKITMRVSNWLWLVRGDSFGLKNLPILQTRH